MVYILKHVRLFKNKKTQLIALYTNDITEISSPLSLTARPHLPLQ